MAKTLALRSLSRYSTSNTRHIWSRYSFGLNVVEIEQGYSIPEHNELERDQEEVFVVLDGDAVMVIDGEEHPAPAGTFTRVAPSLTRTVRNDGEKPVRLLIVSAPTTSGYQDMGWA